MGLQCQQLLLCVRACLAGQGPQVHYALNGVRLRKVQQAWDTVGVIGILRLQPAPPAVQV